MPNHAHRLLPLLLLTSCALHVRAPEPDLPAQRPVPPSHEISYLAAVARLPLTMLGTLLETQAFQPLHMEDKSGFVGWSFDMQRVGNVAVRAQDGILCFMVFFHGKARVQALGGAMEKGLDAAVDVCARPKLTPSGLLHLEAPAVRVALDRVDLPALARPLLDNLAARLEKIAGKQIVDYLATLQVPVGDFVTPTTAALYRPIPLQHGACLQLRPLSLRLAQPEADPTTLRLAASIATQPTVEEPCGPAQKPLRLPMVVDDDLKHPETTLTLPIAVRLQTIRDQVLAQLKALGHIELAGKGNPRQGWIEVTGLELKSAGGALLARAKIRGEVRDRFLFIPFTRKIDGEFLLWGTPVLTDKAIELSKVQVDLETEDGLTTLGAALQRKHIAEIMGERLRIPRAQIEDQAKAALQSLAKGVTVGGQALPVRIETHKLTLDEVRTEGQRLEVLVRFQGYVVLGETGRQ
jgi:hypothetical protein